MAETIFKASSEVEEGGPGGPERQLVIDADGGYPFVKGHEVAGPVFQVPGGTPIMVLGDGSQSVTAVPSPAGLYIILVVPNPPPVPPPPGP